MVFYYNRSAAAAAASRRLLQQNATLEAATYILNQSYVRQPVAERWCADQGGHLVSYDSLEEQVGGGLGLVVARVHAVVVTGSGWCLAHSPLALGAFLLCVTVLPQPLGAGGGGDSCQQADLGICRMLCVSMCLLSHVISCPPL